MDDLAYPMIRKLSSVYVLAHSGFVSRCCPMADLQIDFEIVVFTKTRWLFSYGVTFLPDARGTCCFILSASLCVVRPTYRASHRHKNS